MHEPQHTQTLEDLEARTRQDQHLRTLKRAAYVLIPIIIFSGYMALNSMNKLWKEFSEYQGNIKANLAPNAIYFPASLRRGTTMSFPVFGVNEDVNGDGKYESVLKFSIPDSDELESRLIEDHDGEIRIRQFEVVDGEIRYLE